MARGGWSRSLSGFIGEVEGALGERQKKMVLFALQQLILHSPVQDGAYRSSHFVTVDRRNNIRQPGVPGGNPEMAIQEAESVLDQASGKPFKRVYIQTNIPYGLRIEQGWSGQAPQGVYAIAENNTREQFGG